MRHDNSKSTLIILGILFSSTSLLAADRSGLFLNLGQGNPEGIGMVLIDPLGRRTGIQEFDLSLYEMKGHNERIAFREIPHSEVGYEPSPSNDETGEAATTGRVSLGINQDVLQGEYRISIHPAVSRDFFLDMDVRDANGEMSGSVRLSGTVSAGATQQFSLTVNTAPGGQLVIRPIIDLSELNQNLISSCSGIKMSGNTRSGGTVRTNGVARLSGNALITGNLTAPSLQTTGNASVQGQVTQASGTLSCFPLDLSAVNQLLSARNDNMSLPAGFLTGGTLRVAGSTTLNLSTGIYIVDRLEVSGNARLQASGLVNLFVRQSVSLSGNSEVDSAEAPIRILIASNSEQVLSNRSIRAIFYAPTAKVVLSGNTLFSGRLHAGQVEMTGTSKVEAP